MIVLLTTRREFRKFQHVTRKTSLGNDVLTLDMIKPR